MTKDFEAGREEERKHVLRTLASDRARMYLCALVELCVMHERAGGQLSDQEEVFYASTLDSVYATLSLEEEAIVERVLKVLREEGK